MHFHDPVQYLLTIRPRARVVALIEGVLDVDVDELLDRHELRLEVRCNCGAVVDSDHYHKLSNRILKGLIVDYHRRRGRWRTTSIDDADGLDLEDVSATEAEQVSITIGLRAALDKAIEKALDPQQDCYRGKFGRCYHLYDSLLVRLWRNRPERGQQSKQGRIVAQYFSLYHKCGCGLAHKDRTFACKRLTLLIERIIDNGGLDEYLEP